MHSEVNELKDFLIDKVKGRRFILGIDGLSRSGKTTFTEVLEEVDAFDE